MDCWTFFEIALSFARMLHEPETNRTPEQLVRYIRFDGYRGRERAIACVSCTCRWQEIAGES